MTNRALATLFLLVLLAGCAGQATAPSLHVADRPTITSDVLAKEIRWEFRVLNNGTAASPNATATLEVALLGGEAGGGTTRVAPIPVDATVEVAFTTPYEGWGDYTYRFRVKDVEKMLLEKRGFYEYCGFPC